MRSCYLVRKPRGMAALWGFNRKQMMLSLPLGCPRFLPWEDREKRGPGEGSRELCRSHSRGITLMCHFRHNLAPAAQTSPPPLPPPSPTDKACVLVMALLVTLNTPINMTLEYDINIKPVF